MSHSSDYPISRMNEVRDDNLKMSYINWGKRCFLLTIILTALILFLYFRLYEFLTFEAIKENRMALITFRDENYFITAMSFFLTYIIVVTASVPGATILTMLGGFLFGPVLGSLLVIIGATLGAVLVNLAVELAFRDWVAKRSFNTIKLMEQGIKMNAFSYLLFLRLVPLFPFWLVNIVPAILGVPRRIFFVSTLIGIIPGTVVFVFVGNGLGHIFDNNETPNLGIIFEPKLLLPLCALAILALFPVLYKKFTKTKVHE